MAKLGRESVVAVALAIVLLVASVAPCAQPVGRAPREIEVGPAAGDGTPDTDQRQLQDAIDHLASAGGGTVRIAAGRYMLRAALTLRDNVHVSGVPNKTILVNCDGAAAALAENGEHGQQRIAVKDASAFRPGDGVAIKDDRSPGAFAVTTTTLAEAIDSHAFRLSSPLLQDYAVARHATLIHAFPVVGGWNVHRAVVEGLTIDGNRPKAEYLDGCRGAGIYLYACQGVTIRNCTVRNCRGDGISFQWGSQGVTIEDCLVEKCAGFGLHPGSDSHDSLVRGNRALGNAGPGLFVCENVKHVLFEKNELCNNLGPGISIGCKDTDNVFQANSIKGNGRTGILFRDDGGEAKGAHRNTLDSNVILDNGSAEKSGQPPACIIIVGTHRNLTFRHNTIGNVQPAGLATIGILIDQAPELALDSNKFINLTKETAAAPRAVTPAKAR